MCAYNISALTHIKELKYRMSYIFLSVILNFIVAYFYSLELFYFLAKPLMNLNIDHFEYSLIYTDITEAFFTYLNLSLYISFALSFLFFIHQLIYFLIPGLYNKEEKNNVYHIHVIFFTYLFFLFNEYTYNLFLYNTSYMAFFYK